MPYTGANISLLIAPLLISNLLPEWDIVPVPLPGGVLEALAHLLPPISIFTCLQSRYWRGGTCELHWEMQHRNHTQ